VVFLVTTQETGDTAAVLVTKPKSHWDTLLSHDSDKRAGSNRSRELTGSNTGEQPLSHTQRPSAPRSFTPVSRSQEDDVVALASYTLRAGLREMRLQDRDA